MKKIIELYLRTKGRFRPEKLLTIIDSIMDEQDFGSKQRIYHESVFERGFYRSAPGGGLCAVEYMQGSFDLNKEKIWLTEVGKDYLRNPICANFKLTSLGMSEDNSEKLYSEIKKLNLIWFQL